jgi:5,5'-dehydrodivanillate O-demethylase oxygenase subunit
MLTKDENDLFMRVGPGTPVGDLLRRYWHPVGCSELVTAKPQRIKVFGEDLVLYRAEDGDAVVMDLRCAHRRVALDFGRVEGDCIRCPYHGWLYDRSGQCIEQPAEPEGSSFKDKVRLASYPVQEFSGLVFAYMGPGEAPLLPLYDVLRMTDGVKEVMMQTVQTNWLAHAENTVDISHLAWLHGYTFPAYGARKLTYHWNRKDYGIDNVMLIEGSDDTHVSCVAYPTVNRFALPPVDASGELVLSMIFRVPIDDESIKQYFVRFYPSEKHSFVTRARDPKPGVYAPLANDWWGIDVPDQDRMAIEQQGVMPDRTHERLGASDGGIILLRQIMRESLAAIEEGNDPPCVIRDATKQVIDFPQKSSIMKETQAGADYALGAAGNPELATASSAGK